MAKFSVAPMIDWTDRHCRYFHRLMSKETLLYTEMIVAPALIHGDPARLLAYDASEHPVAVQLGGSDPAQLAQATRICVSHGYDEINLNVGCPSDKVQSGCFGAVLMENPALVRDCVAAMLDASDGVPVTVKCRIGVDDQEPEVVLPQFIETVAEAGVRHFTIHARKAWLQGLSPKENREIPPLDYPLVFKMKADFPELWIGINGGIDNLETASDMLKKGIDSVMIGRAAYQRPADILLNCDSQVFDGKDSFDDPVAVVEAMYSYMEAELSKGVKLGAMTRHMLGIFAGKRGARQWRRTLSDGAHKPGAGLELVREALSAVVE